MSSKLCLELACGLYLLALDRIERLQATVARGWDSAEEFLDDAVEDLAWAGRQVELAGQQEEWRKLLRVIEELPYEEDVKPEQAWTPEISGVMFEECCQTCVIG